MKPVETRQDPRDQQARAALEALDQAYAYYTPETPVAPALDQRQEQLFEYYQAA